jgi:choline dehydrogenase
VTERYDFLIVGGGSAGCALANRLSTDPSNRVLVLEAGRPDYPWDIYIHMPAALTFPIGNRFYDWKYESEPEPHMHGRRIYHARGKVLGGSSSINGMIFQRGNPLDYERWSADPGMQTWDYAHCLPYFRRMEQCLAAEPGDEFRGAAGPLVLERGPATNPLFGAFFEAARQAGFELTDDVNGYRQEGFAAFDRNIHRGRRLSAAGAYLHPVMSRPNLEVRTRTFVTRILFEGSRAVGVEAARGRSSPATIRAGEVIVQFDQDSRTIFDVPVTVTLQYADGHLQDVLVPISDAHVEQRIPTTGIVRDVQINRDSAALARFSES